MLRVLLPLAAIFLASADDTASCALHGAEAVDELLDSAVYIWASVETCSHAGSEVRCEVNVASAIEAVNGMINVIMKAIHKCGELKHAKCGMAAGALTEGFAGLAAASGGIAAKCDTKLNPGQIQTVRGAMQNAGSYAGDARNQKFGACIVDIKSSMKSFFKVIKRLMTVKHNCKHGMSKHCVHNSLKIVAAFANLGAFIANAVGHCDAHKFNGDAYCAAQSMRLVNEVNNVAKAGVAMAKECHEDSDSRLYLLDEEDDEAPASSSSSVTMALAAMLPITAVLAFVGGSRLAKARSQPVRDFEELSQM